MLRAASIGTRLGLELLFYLVPWDGR